MFAQVVGIGPTAIGLESIILPLYDTCMYVYLCKASCSPCCFVPVAGIEPTSTL